MFDGLNFRLTLFVLIFIIPHTKIVKGAAVPHKCNEKPDKKAGRNSNCHNEISDLMTQMHKFCNNKKCLCECHYNKDAVQNMLGEKMCFIINDCNDELKHSYAKQDPECPPDRFRIK